MSSTTLTRLRLVGRLEAVSFLLLLGVAMPLKYLWSMPLATKLVGWPHGILFMAYCYLLMEAAGRYRFGAKLTLGLFLAAWLPFGPFVAERYLPQQAPGERPAEG